MNQHLMKGFKLLASQFGRKLGVMGDSSSSQSEERRKWVSIFFQEQDPIIDPMNFRAHQGLLNLNLFYPNKSLTLNLN